jgi:hypothetical protein
VSDEVRCAQCERVIPDPKHAWRVRFAARPFYEHRLHASCVRAFMDRHPPLKPQREHAVWCPRTRAPDDPCACRPLKPSQ